MRDKKLLTDALVKELDPELGITTKVAMTTWWINFRSNGGMRLTKMGYFIFDNELELAKYEYIIENPVKFTQKLVLAMDRKLQTPYYIETEKNIPKKVIFFGSREAVMTTLYGDLKRFLDNYTP